MRRVALWRIMARMNTSTEHNDRQLLGVVVRHELVRRYGRLQAAANSIGVSKKSIERIIKGEATVEWDTLDFIERQMDLPRDTFRCITLHEFNQLEEIGVEADLVRWIRQEMANFQAPASKRTKAV